MIRLLAAGLALAVAGDDGNRAKLLKGRVAAAPVDCVPLSAMADGPVIVDADTIMVGHGERIYLTHPTGHCPGLQPSATLIVDARGGAQLCRNDGFRVAEPGRSIASARCRFDRFTPWERPRR